MDKLEHNRKKYGGLPHGIYLGEDLLITEDTRLFPRLLKAELPSKHHTLILCTAGTLETRYDSRNITLRKDNLLVLCEGRMTEMQHFSPDFKAKMIFISPNFGESLRQKDYLSVYLRVLKEPIVELEETEAAIVRKSFEVLGDLMNLKYNTERRKIAVHMIQMLFHVISQFEHFNVEDKQQKLRNQQLFESFLFLFKKEYRQSHEVAYYADKLCISPNYLSKIALNLTGKSVKKWMKEVLMGQACTKLRSMNGPSIKEISDMLGYANPSLFSRAFKKYMGIGPREYREAKGL